MSDFVLFLGSAFALMLVIEGLLYALFTDSVRRMMGLALTLPPEKLRMAGFSMAAAGAGLAWILQVIL